MIGYGSAKSAAHHLIQSWGPTCHEENNTTAVGILPLMIDTPANRAMLEGGNEDGGGDDDDDMTALLAVEEEDTVDLLHNIIIFEGRGG